MTMMIEEVRLALREHVMDLLDETGMPLRDETGDPSTCFIEAINDDIVHVVHEGDEFYFRLALMPRHALDGAERLFLEMARLERMTAEDQGVTEPLIWRVGTERGEEAVRLDVPGNEALMADYATGRRRRPTRLEIERGLDHQRAAEAEAHQERGEAGEADATDEQEEEFIRAQIERHERDAATDPRSREALEFFKSELAKLQIDPPGWKEPREPGGDEANRGFLYYDAQTGDVVEALAAPDARRWYRLVEDFAAAVETFEQDEFPLIFDTQQTNEQFRAMPQADRDVLMGRLHWQQYGRSGAPLLAPAEDLQQRMGWRSDVPPLDEDADVEQDDEEEEDRRRSSAAPRPAWLASASARPVTPRLGGQPGLPTFQARPEPEPDPTAPDPLMEGLKEPLFPLAGARRFVPRSVTDVEGLDRQLEPDRLKAGSWWPEAPKPNEMLTPRTGGILDELERQERMDLPEPTEMAGLVPLGEYLRRLTG